MSANSGTIKVLLLNSTYEPLKIVSWQKAIFLWFQDKAEILEYSEFSVNSSSRRFRLPSVLRLKSFIRHRSLARVRFCRENVYVRDNYTCQYCGKLCSPRDLTLDHVVPASRSGLKTWTNVVSACRPCNQKKANRTPHSAGMPLLVEPRVPVWLPSPDLDPIRNSFPETWLVYLSPFARSS